MKTRKLQIEISEETFQYLEVLAYGLYVENNTELDSIYDKSKDDFSKGVRSILCEAASSLANGVRRPLSNEADIVKNITFWEGTFNKGMFGDIVKNNDDIAFRIK